MSSSKRAATLDLVNLAYKVREGRETKMQAESRRKKRGREGERKRERGKSETKSERNLCTSNRLAAVHFKESPCPVRVDN